MPESTFPISCFACEPITMHKGDAAYLAHMQSVHGGMTQAQVLQQQKEIEKNIPRAIPLDKNDPPPKEFMELVKMMDQPQKIVSHPIKVEAKVSNPVRQEEKKVKDKKPLHLTYKWEGQCSQCENTVKTLVIHNFAIAYCLSCDEEIKQQEIHPLDKPKDIYNTFAPKHIFDNTMTEIAKRDKRLYQELIDKEEIEKILLERRKEAIKRHGKRKPKLFRKTSVQTTVSDTGMPKIN